MSVLHSGKERKKKIKQKPTTNKVQLFDKAQKVRTVSAVVDTVEAGLRHEFLLEKLSAPVISRVRLTQRQ